ncbi:MAG TPA: T9SS type A sorting domain-containing protein, partial [Candidatus Kapabacteria bacterium]|nr:T9SS type A sorting domain-containing protein [Candidatus Kapabacteria bacterium]
SLTAFTAVSYAQNSWTLVASPIWGIQALNDDTLVGLPETSIGYSTNSANLYYSTDMGKNWKSKTAGISQGYSFSFNGFYAANFSSPTVFGGWVLINSIVPAWGKFIARTNDGGNSWYALPFATDFDHYVGVGSSDSGYVLLSTAPYMSGADIGDTVIEYFPLRDSLVTLFNDSTRKYIVAKQCSMTLSGQGLLLLQPYDSQVYYSQRVTVLSTLDNGRKWTDITSLFNDTIQSTCIHNDAAWLVGGMHGIYRSSDSGLTWTKELSTNVAVVQLSIRDEKIAYALLSGEYYFVESTDGGQSWIKQFGVSDEGPSSFQIFGSHSILLGGSSYNYYLKRNDSIVHTPIIHLSSRFMNLGMRILGQTQSIFDTLQNIGDDTLQVSAIIAKGYAVTSASPNHFTLAPDSSLVLQLSVLTDSLSRLTDTLIFQGNFKNTDPGIQIDITGLGSSSKFWTSTGDFGWVQQGKPSSGEILIESNGPDSLRVSSVHTQSSELSIADTSFLTPEEVLHRLNFSIDATSLGSHAASIILSDNALNGFDTIEVHWNAVAKSIDYPWQYLFNSPSSSTGLISLLADSTNNIICLSWQGKQFDAYATLFLTKLSSSGKLLWRKPIPYLQNLSSAIDKAGDIFLYGYSSDTVKLLKYNRDGNLVFSLSRWAAEAIGLAVNVDGYFAIAYNTGEYSWMDTSAYPFIAQYRDNGDGIAEEFTPNGQYFDQLYYKRTSDYNYPASVSNYEVYGQDRILSVGLSMDGRFFTSATIDIRHWTGQYPPPPPEYENIMDERGGLRTEVSIPITKIIPDLLHGAFATSSSLTLHRDSTGWINSIAGTGLDQLLPGNQVLEGDDVILDTALRVVRQFSLPDGSANGFVDRFGILYAMLASDSLLIRIDTHDTFLTMQPYRNDSLPWSLTSYAVDPNDQITAAVTRTHSDSTQDFVIVHHAHAIYSAVRQERPAITSRSISVYPQPAKTDINILLPFDRPTQMGLEIHDVCGRLVFSSFGEYASSCSLHNLALIAGTYFISVHTANGDIFYNKILIE